MNIIHNEGEVTIEQLKEILKPMENKEEQLIKEAKERGYTHDNFKCLIDRKCEGIKDIENWYYEIFEDTLYTNTEGEGGNVVYRDGVWAEIIKPMENKEEQLRKEAVERGFVNGVEFFGSQGIDSDKPMLICDNISYAKPNEGIGIWGLYVNNSWLCYNGTWGTLAEETLEQQLEKAEAEVKRLREAVEEENNIKIGDWVKRKNLGIEIFKADNTHDYRYINSEKGLYQKITDSVLLESLNKLFKH